MKRRRVEVNVGELDRLLEGARKAPLSDPDYEKISTALHALVDALAKPRSTEKSSSVVGRKDEPGGQTETGSSANQDQRSESKPPGHRAKPPLRHTPKQTVIRMDAMEPMHSKARERWRPSISS
jgi:hypothetical protein